MVKKVLVTGANGDISDAVGRILREYNPNIELHGADCAGEWPGKALFSFMHFLPKGTDPSYTSRLTDLVRKQGFDLIIPMSEVELLRLSNDWDILADLPLLMNNPMVVRTFCDKQATADWMRDHNLPMPYTMPLSQATVADLPLFVKPQMGYGSKGTDAVFSEEQLKAVQMANREGMIAQAYLPPSGGECTCAVVRFAGELRTLVLKRQLQGGLTGRAEVVDNPDIEGLLMDIAEQLDLEGFINVQLMLTPDGPKLFEINPRFSSTVMMRHRLGFCDLIWAIEARHGVLPPAFVAPVGAKVFRLSREVVVL